MALLQRQRRTHPYLPRGTRHRPRWPMRPDGSVAFLGVSRVRNGDLGDQGWRLGTIGGRRCDAPLTPRGHMAKFHYFSEKIFQFSFLTIFYSIFANNYRIGGWSQGNNVILEFKCNEENNNT